MQARLLILFALLGCSFAANFVSNALGDNMVLQRGQKARLWGWTQAGAHVKGKLTGDAMDYAAIADSNGYWFIDLEPHVASFTPQQITLLSSNGQNATLKNILFGDVFICSGQSNMQLSVAAVFNASEEISKANNYPFIRLFTVGTGTTSLEPLNEFNTISQHWTPASSASVGNGIWSYFSATCWFFATHLHEQKNVPLGLVSSNWGGTPVQAWSSKDALAKCQQPEEDDLESNPSPGTDSVLYNAMIVPLLNMRVKGAVWYQGEANAGQSTYYSCQFPAMIADWRVKFNYEPNQFGFYFVQLAPWTGDNSAIAEIREAQLSALKLPYVGFGTAADLGDATSPEGNIHPRNKQEVGRRLALAAEAITYGLPVKWRGPTFSQFSQTSQNSVQVEFDPSTVGSSGLFNKNFKCPVDADKCTGFEVRVGNSWESAQISGEVSGNKVTLTHAAGQVSQVRYGWSAWPALTLYNREDLPAIPFMSQAK